MKLGKSTDQLEVALSLNRFVFTGPKRNGDVLECDFILSWLLDRVALKYQFAGKSLRGIAPAKTPLQ